MRSHITNLLCTALMLAPLSVLAFGEADYLKWFEENQSATPQFVDGDVITYDKSDLVRPFIPAEFHGEWIFEGMEMKINTAAAADMIPAKKYMDATAKHDGEAQLASDGAIENYAAGRPFDPEKFVPGSDSGWKMVWNWNYRWQNDGLSVGEVDWVWIRRGGTHDDHDIMKIDGGKYAQFYEGGGTFERALKGPYKRYLMSHNVNYADTDYRVNSGKGFAKGTEFREYTGFVSPFDISGTAFLILRYDDPRKADDSWAYIPSLRRVRRISVEVKSDALLGTDHTLEDFYGFNGRPMEHNWEYIGTTNILVVARSRARETVYYGPNGWAIKDDYAMRKTDVMKQIPKSDAHPYSFKFIHIDRVTGESYYANAFDKAGELWKVWQLTKVYSEDPWVQKGSPYARRWSGGDTSFTPPGTNFQLFQSINVIDLQNNRGTVVPCRGTEAEDTSFKVARRVLDVNYLTEGR